MNKRFLLKCLVAALLWLSVEKGVAQENVGSQPKTILFIGNSFTFAHHSSAMYYHPESLTDLNDTKIGGVPVGNSHFSFVISLWETLLSHLFNKTFSE